MHESLSLGLQPKTQLLPKILPIQRLSIVKKKDQFFISHLNLYKITFNIKSYHTTKSPHLKLRNFMLRMALQSRINHSFNHFMSFQIFCDNLSIFTMLFHSYFKRFYLPSFNPKRSAYIFLQTRLYLRPHIDCVTVTIEACLPIRLS